MSMARIVVDPQFTVAPVDRRLFGSFVEHMGRCVYTGIYEPEHPLADQDGFRKDVLALTGELGVSTIRYPGGNFVSNYRWEDGVGPKEQRPVRRDLAWRSIETNQFGIDEFVDWSRRAGVEPMVAVNLGTRGVAEAVDLLEYCNSDAGTALADQRVANGHAEPHDVKLWCLGNEMDGPWQIGHKTAEEYGRLAQETGKAMKRLDPSIELVACGSSNSKMPTFGSWESTVLEHCYEVVDYISLHAYYEQHGDDVASYLASGVDMDRFIEAVAATADAVGARLQSRKRLRLSFDEWNVWFQGEFGGEDSLDWAVAPQIIENDFGTVDAVVVGGLLVSLLKHADRVGVACLAQLVNVIAPIRTEPGGRSWRQPIFAPFALTAEGAQGVVLQTAAEGPTITTAEFGEIPTVDTVATWDQASGTTSVFAVNRSPEESVRLTIATQGLPAVRTATAVQMAVGGAGAAAGSDESAWSPRETAVELSDEGAAIELAPGSWTRVTLVA
ncbi:MAG: alpha-L-arabinofuranosidase [Cellulomonas sp. 73-145]|uniref:arabinosylfuranosidase ArfA n=1 Tax=Cellulomonas sp. 73-145 TaxID=1895739 RepID=UPI000927ABF3|nr:alpha-N-arabinofuranosidase [Cellulomonas sp. 73-145]MBN9325591.1 alpha-N-arabinofuranosidase [Cellulomonas sp.]OJV57068.1 MAG: alpha-L-arabinofuranosidase [Cellulomonas sp. 73-145]